MFESLVCDWFIFCLIHVRLVQRPDTIDALVICIWSHTLQALRDVVACIVYPLPKALQQANSPYLPQTSFEYVANYPSPAPLNHIHAI